MLRTLSMSRFRMLNIQNRDVIMGAKLTVSDRIRKRMKDLNIKSVDITKATGISSGGVSQWLSGITTPNGANLTSLCAFLKCSADWLLHGKGDPDQTSSEPILPFGLISRRVHGLLSTRNLAQLTLHDAPPHSESILVDSKFSDHGRYFITKIDNDSMTNTQGKHSFAVGDYLIFDKARGANSGDYVLVYNKQDDTSTFKKLSKDGSVSLLIALNTIYPARAMSEDDTIIGTLAAYQPAQQLF